MTTVKFSYTEDEAYTLMTWLAAELQSLAKSQGFKNIFQPGLMREIIIARILGHKANGGKRGTDASDHENQNIHYEYLSSFLGNFQMDRMYGYTKSEEQQRQSLERIIRNKYFFHVLFDKDNPLKVLKIWKISSKVILEEAKKQLSVSSADHISFNKQWTEENGELVYND